MRNDFGALFAAAAALRDDPTAQELSGGIPCGPFRQKLLNEMFFALSSVLAECNTILDASNIQPDELATNQLLAALQAQFAATAGATATLKRVLFLTSAQTILIASGETRARARGWGGGGAGGGSSGNPSGGSGGGGGGSFDAFVTGLTTGQMITCPVGAGGPGGPAAASGQAPGGGTTSFGAYASATGGTGGYASSSVGTSGLVGTGGIGTLASGVLGRTYTGSPGGSTYGIAGNQPMSGYGGACQMGGAHAPWGTNNVSGAGAPGNYPGGGGSSSINQASGGNGADGLLIVEIYG